MAATQRAHVMVLLGLVTALMALSLLFGCDSPVSRTATETLSSAVPQLVRQPDGQEWMVIDLSQIAGLSIGKSPGSSPARNTRGGWSGDLR